MGMVRLWDGNDLPEVGSEVLVHLSSCKVWVRHVVTGYKVSKSREYGKSRVEVQLDPSADHRSSKNARLYDDILPVHAVEKVGEQQKEVIASLSERLAKKEEEVHALIERLEELGGEEVVESME